MKVKEKCFLRRVCNCPFKTIGGKKITSFPPPPPYTPKCSLWEGSGEPRTEISTRAEFACGKIKKKIWEEEKPPSSSSSWRIKKKNTFTRRARRHGTQERIPRGRERSELRNNNNNLRAAADLNRLRFSPDHHHKIGLVPSPLRCDLRARPEYRCCLRTRVDEVHC